MGSKHNRDFRDFGLAPSPLASSEPQRARNYASAQEAGVAVRAVEFILGRPWRCSSILATLVVALFELFILARSKRLLGKQGKQAGSNKSQFHPIQEERGLVSIYL